MSSVPRRTIPELALLHELEADLKDIFVEGSFDASIVHRFLAELGVSAVSVRRIETVEIDDGWLLMAGRDNNNRERVIWLAEAFEREFRKGGKILCIADRDYGTYIGDLVTARDLVYTDGCCMEAYMWNEVCFMRFLSIFCNKPEWNPREVLDGIRESLEGMFALRLAGKMLDLQLNWIDKNVCVGYSGGKVNLRLDELARRLLAKIGKTNELDTFVAVARENIESFGPDPKNQIHGHDFIRVLVYFLRKRGVSKVALDLRTTVRAMALTPTREELEGQPLFAAIKSFANENQ